MASEANDNWANQSTFCCATCRFFVEKPGQPVGRCRRQAPVVEKGWPAVYPTDWCGEHKLQRALPQAAF